MLFGPELMRGNSCYGFERMGKMLPTIKAYLNRNICDRGFV